MTPSSVLLVAAMALVAPKEAGVTLKEAEGGLRALGASRALAGVVECSRAMEAFRETGALLPMGERRETEVLRFRPRRGKGAHPERAILQVEGVLRAIPSSRVEEDRRRIPG